MNHDRNIIDLESTLRVRSLLQDLDRLVPQGVEGASEAYDAVVQAMGELGTRALVKTLCGLLADERHANAAAFALETIGGQDVIDRMLDLLQDENVPQEASVAAAGILSALGRRVPAEVLFAHDPADALSDEEARSARESLLESFEEIPVAERAFGINSLFEEHCALMRPSERHGFLTDLLQSFGQPDDASPDVLYAFREFGSDVRLREAAAELLLSLAARGVEPSKALVEATYAWRFQRALQSDGPGQRVMLVLGKNAGRYQIHSFLIDEVYWGGALKDYWVAWQEDEGILQELKSRYESEGLGRMKPVGRNAAMRHLGSAVERNVEFARPLPGEFRRYGRLAGVLLDFDLTKIPSASEESVHSALDGKPRDVEFLIRSGMVGAEFDAETVWNARMLWRDYYENERPRVGKLEAWASAVQYVIGVLDGTGATQKEVASQYGVSPGTVSQRAARLKVFLTYERPVMSYTSRTPHQLPEEWQPEDLFDDDVPEEDFFLEDAASETSFLLMYQQYVGACAEGGQRPIAFEAFQEALSTLSRLQVAEQTGAALTAADRRKLHELKQLLLVDDD